MKKKQGRNKGKSPEIETLRLSYTAKKGRDFRPPYAVDNKNAHFKIIIFPVLVNLSDANL